MIFHKALFFLARAHQAALQRLKYTRLREAVLQHLSEQLDDPYVVVVPWMFAALASTVEVAGWTEHVTLSDIEKMWPQLVQDLGLVDDGTQTETWTLPGRSYIDQEHSG